MAESERKRSSNPSGDKWRVSVSYGDKPPEEYEGDLEEASNLYDAAMRQGAIHVIVRRLPSQGQV